MPQRSVPATVLVPRCCCPGALSAGCGPRVVRLRGGGPSGQHPGEIDVQIRRRRPRPGRRPAPRRAVPARFPTRQGASGHRQGQSRRSGDRSGGRVWSGPRNGLRRRRGCVRRPGRGPAPRPDSRTPEGPVSSADSARDAASPDCHRPWLGCPRTGPAPSPPLTAGRGRRLPLPGSRPPRTRPCSPGRTMRPHTRHPGGGGRDEWR